jgi:hypothetical protein
MLGEQSGGSMRLLAVVVTALISLLRIVALVAMMFWQ